MQGFYIKCPICGRAVSRDDPQLPFCSERCRLLDLGKWASGQYRIPSAIAEEEPAVPEDQEPDGKEQGE